MVDGIYDCSLTFKDEGRHATLCKSGVMKLYWHNGQLKGSMFPSYFWLDSPFRGGKVDGNEFSFTVYFATPCQQYCAEVEGEVDGDRVSGTYKNPLGVYTLEGIRRKD